jgi:hypothetical protein
LSSRVRSEVAEGSSNLALTLIYSNPLPPLAASHAGSSS